MRITGRPVTASRLPNFEYVANYAISPGRATVVGRVLLEGGIAHIADVLADAEYGFRDGQKLGGYRAVLGVPLLREGSPIGVLLLMRPQALPFSAKQIDLATTFADQAVIAIENVRLFEEAQTRTRELQEALEYQTATSDILEVISRSPSDIRPVLDRIVEVALRLCEFLRRRYFPARGRVAQGSRTPGTDYD